MKQPAYGADVAFRMASVFLHSLQTHTGGDTFLPGAGPFERQRIQEVIAEMIARCKGPRPSIDDYQVVERFLVSMCQRHVQGRLFDDDSEGWLTAVDDVLKMTLAACSAVAGANDPVWDSRSSTRKHEFTHPARVDDAY